MTEQNITLVPGESRLVSFEAIPQEARTYQVSVNGLAGSFKTIVEPYHELLVGGIAITSCHGRKFIETGIDTDGIPYDVAESPVEGVMVGLYIYYRNVSANIPYGVQFQLIYEPTWAVSFPCDCPPLYWSNTPGRVLQGELSTAGALGQSSYGYCCRGMYDAKFVWGPLNWQGWPDNYYNFRIKNILQCTVSKELPI